MFDKAKFKYEMNKQGITPTEVAEKLGITRVTLYRKMNGESDFYRNEIEKCAQIFRGDNINDIFSQKVT